MSILNQSILDITYINTPPALILILKMLLDLFARWHFFSSKILVIVVIFQDFPRHINKLFILQKMDKCLKKYTAKLLFNAKLFNKSRQVIKIMRMLNINWEMNISIMFIKFSVNIVIVVSMFLKQKCIILLQILLKIKELGLPKCIPEIFLMIISFSYK